MKSAPKVGILIVLYNSITHLEALARSIQSQTYKSFALYAIDCNESPNETKFLTEKFPSTYIHPSIGNVGFARGNNILAEKAMRDGCSLLLILNPDIEMAENTLLELVAMVGRESSVGASSCVVLFGNHKEAGGVIQSFGQKVDFIRQKKDLLFANQKLTESRLPNTLQVDSVVGGCVLLKATVVRDVGLFEEDYFMYNDETDLFLRMRKRDYKVVVTSKTQVWHHHDWSANNINGNVRMYYYMMRNRFLYYRKFRLWFPLFADLLMQILSLPIKARWFRKVGSIRILQYYYLGILNGILGEKGRSPSVL